MKMDGRNSLDSSQKHHWRLTKTSEETVVQRGLQKGKREHLHVERMPFKDEREQQTTNIG
jgi:hypothetical protein